MSLILYYYYATIYPDYLTQQIEIISHQKVKPFSVKVYFFHRRLIVLTIMYFTQRLLKILKYNFFLLFFSSSFEIIFNSKFIYSFLSVSVFEDSNKTCRLVEVVKAGLYSFK